MMCCRISMKQKPVDGKAQHGKGRIVPNIIIRKKGFDIEALNIFIMKQDIAVVPADKCCGEQSEIDQHSQQAKKQYVQYWRLAVYERRRGIQDKQI